MPQRLAPKIALASLALLLTPRAATAAAPRDKATPEVELSKKEPTRTPERDLAGDITRRKHEKVKDRPALEYDQFRLGVELQVASKRREQIDTLQRIIALGPAAKEAPALLFRLAELYWEESKSYFFESNRQDDAIINARAQTQEARVKQAEAEKRESQQKSDQYQARAIEQYRTIIKNYPKYERMDEVLFFLGHNMWDSGKSNDAVVVYKKLIKDHPNSKYLPDAWVAIGQFAFNSSQGHRGMLEDALGAFKKAAAYTENKVYGYALYMQGWCYYNLGDFRAAMDLFRAVVYYGELQGRDDTRSTALSREARKDYVIAYSRIGDALAARGDFQKVGGDEHWWAMLKGLANLYYEDGKDKEATLVYNQMIREKPLSPEAPFFQGRIVDCVMRVGNKRLTVTQVRELVRIITEVGKSGVLVSDDDKRAFADAQDLAERTLSNLAVNWHNEAKKTRDDATFALAAEVYQDYLTIFSEGAKAYDLRFFYAELLNDNLGRFDRAAEEYTRVLLTDVKRLEATPPEKAGRWRVDAAYNAVLAWDEVARRQEKDEPARGNAKGELPIPPAKQGLLAACERYIQYVPDGDKRVEVMFKAGNIYYRYNRFEKAVDLFAHVALDHPDSELAEYAANLVLDSFNLQGDWAKMNAWARRFFAQPKLAKGKFRDELARVLEQSAFKLVNGLEEKSDFVGAAEAYLAFVNEFPRSEIADLALFNASVDFFKGKQVDRSIEVRKQLVARYPKSSYLPQCIYANGESYETIGDFEPAAEAYEAYAAGWAQHHAGRAAKPVGAKPPPKSAMAAAGSTSRAAAAAPQGGDFEESKAQVALNNAGIFREGLGQAREALRDRQRYVELWPDGKDTETVFLSIADLYEKSGQGARAIAQLEEYQRRYGKDTAKSIAADGRIVRIHQAQGNAHAAARVQARINADWDKLSRSQKERLSPAALEAVAGARLEAIESDFQQYSRLGFPRDEKKIRSALDAKQRALVEVQKRYAEVVALKAAQPAICALYKIGLLYKNFADSLNAAPVPEMQLPPKLDPIKHLLNVPYGRWPRQYRDQISQKDYEDLKAKIAEARVQFDQAYRDQLTQWATPVEDKAADGFATAVEKSRELGIYNDCAARALDLLSEKYNPVRYPRVSERLAELRAGAELREGNGLLTAVQPVPVASPGPQRNSSRAAEPPPDLSRLESRPSAVPASAPPKAATRPRPPPGPMTEPQDPDLLK